MKKIIFSLKKLVVPILSIVLLGIASCTDRFEEYNTDPDGLTREQLQGDFNYIGGLYPSIQEAYTASNMMPMIVGDYYTAGTFGGYFMSNAPNPRYANYEMNIPSLDAYHIFNVPYNSIMAPIQELKRRKADIDAPDFWTIAKILKVAGMVKIVDYYGPIPYSQYGQGGTSVTYDKQEDVYDSFFADLDSAVIVLNDFIAQYPDAEPFSNFDRIFDGDYNKWVRYANTLRLRLALHIVKVNPAKAKQVAEKAVAEGVMVSNSDNAILKQSFYNSLLIASLEWINIMSNASIVTYMDGYKDPRISKYFDFSSIPGYTDKYVGIRNGASILTRQLNYSNLAASSFPDGYYTPTQVMVAAEAYFLRAEGVLRGWNMGGGTAKEYYEMGIETSFAQFGLSSAADTYINDATSKPADCVDPVYPVNDIPALSDITVKWDEASTNEQKLERIVTQKWIAYFPDYQEAWTTYRRTGYPKIFPVKVNNSNGKISTEIQIRRLPYPLSEVDNNPSGYATGIDYLRNEKGASAPGETTNTGEDTGGTRLWWDVAGPNF